MGILTYINGKYKHIRRYNQIISIFLKYGFEDLVAYMEEEKRFRFLKKLIPKKTYEHATHLSKWERWRLLCEELGPTFIKFGQILSNRTDLLPMPLIIELEKLQDNVPPVSWDIALKAIERELINKKTEDVFVWLDEKALASASMAQVHRAILKTGEKVVLKIQRPGIKEVILSDIKVMYYLADLFNRRIPTLKSFDPIGLVKNFEDSIIKELDFIHESMNLQRFINNFNQDPKLENKYIKAPIVYKDFTTSKLLTLEYIDGIKISDIEKLKQNGYDRKIIARRLSKSYLRQVFNYGFFHADPHPGNLLVLPHNNICYLDFGMMGSIMKKDVEQLGFLFISVKNKDVRKIIQSLQHLADNPPIKNFRALEADLTEFVYDYSVLSIHENEMSTILLKLKDIIVLHGLRIPTHFFLLARSLVSLEGVLKKLDPALDLGELARPFLVRTIAKKYDPIKFTKGIFNSVYEMGVYLEELPRDLKNVIQKINKGEVKVDLHHKGIEPLIHTINRITRQIISTILVAALIICSTLSFRYNIAPYWGDTSVLGIIMLSVGVVILFRMIKDLRKGDHDNWKGWEED